MTRRKQHRQLLAPTSLSSPAAQTAARAGKIIVRDKLENQQNFDWAPLRRASAAPLLQSSTMSAYPFSLVAMAFSLVALAGTSHCSSPPSPKAEVAPSLRSDYISSASALSSSFSASALSAFLASSSSFFFAVSTSFKAFHFL